MQARPGIVGIIAAAALVVAGAALLFELGSDHTEGAAIVVASSGPVDRVGGAWHPYAPAAFTGDLATHRTVLVAVHANWCTDCAAQAPILARLLNDGEFAAAAGYVVDFDKERTFLATHKVRQQSTLLVFKDGVEVARSVADTNEGRIRALFERGL